MENNPDTAPLKAKMAVGDDGSHPDVDPALQRSVDAREKSSKLVGAEAHSIGGTADAERSDRPAIGTGETRHRETHSNSPS